MSTKSSTTTQVGSLAISAMFGATMAAVAMTDWPWPLVVGAAFILLVLVQGLRHRQNGNQRRPAAPGAGLLGATFGAAALLIRGTSEASWAGPALGVVAFAGAFAYLGRGQGSTGGDKD